MMNKKPKSPIFSVRRAFILLEILSENGRGLGVSELAIQTGWPKSSIHNNLSTMVEDGYLTQDPETRRYRMTIKLFSLSGKVVDRLNIRQVAYPLLTELMEEVRETVNLGILDAGEAIYVESIPGPSAIHVSTWPGKRIPIHRTAVGKALAAELAPDELNTILSKIQLTRGTDKTHRTMESLREDLALTHQRGYALDDEEDEMGLRCLGAPIRDLRGKTVAAVSVTAIAQRLPIDQIPEVANKVMNIADRISELLGYHRTIVYRGEREETSI
jgi:IclR family acetate operon transcriptional repressor